VFLLAQCTENLFVVTNQDFRYLTDFVYVLTYFLALSFLLLGKTTLSTILTINKNKPEL